MTGEGQAYDMPLDVGATVAGEHADPGAALEDGDRACLAHLVCPECGSVVSEGHRRDCSHSDES